MMTLGDMLEQLGLYDMLDNATEEESKILEMEIEIHQQPNYPLKGDMVNTRITDGVIQVASGTASEYGDQEAWEE